MGLSVLPVCCESINFKYINHTNESEWVFYDGSIEWE